MNTQACYTVRKNKFLSRGANSVTFQFPGELVLSSGRSSFIDMASYGILAWNITSWLLLLWTAHPVVKLVSCKSRAFPHILKCPLQGAKKTAQSVECLLYTCEDLSSDPEHSHKKPSMMCLVSVPPIGDWDRRIPEAGASVSPMECVTFKFG